VRELFAASFPEKDVFREIAGRCAASLCRAMDLKP
jgi:hypothetical protein